MTIPTLFAGNSNSDLARNIAYELGTALGEASVDRFADSEINVEVRENVRGKDVFLLQSTCRPANDHLMELLILADAVRRSSAHRITAVLPYFGYARQDRRPRSARVSISAKVVADMVAVAGINRVLTVDLHADQIQGFFNIPVDNVYGSPVLIDHALSRNYENPLVVSPDVGGVVRARAIAKQMHDVGLAIIDKRRPTPNEAEVVNIIGDVENRTCILVDDIVDTAGTLCNSADELKRRGACKVIAYITHAVLSGNALETISESGVDEMFVTDTIPLTPEAQAVPKIKQLSLAPLLAEAIRRVSNEESISVMFR
ncbi:MAG: ribose-phosphate pyrophosphokinase [Gammaproteobacteria bacterium]|nr:ribose-phosphate pyrophosphokinase [Gammaproteobacteria bacterium]MCY4200263.1 ribose-phosphate pyrophosphokinase [Gammaproteobacteria bacterium]MCY4277980.1 ribose-phosphate pyrophosphokinase [Gammaproteobacteria bacterium]MCY4322829.1 ribose-phosphate pyrophosphokinase [Gammaproteobacteria bacterium]